MTDPLARRDIPFNVVDISEGKLGIEVAPAAAPALSRIAETYIKNGHLSMDRFPNLEAFNKRAYAERGAEGLPLSPDEAAAVYTMNYGIDAVEIARSQQGITSEGMKDYELAYGLNGQGVNTPTPRETPAIRYADGEVGWMAVDVDDLKEAYGLRDLLKSQGVEAEAWRGKDGVAHVVCSEEMMQACTSMTDVESWVKSPAGEQAVMQAAASGLEKVDEIDSVHQSMEECSKKAETERKLGSEHAGSVDRIEVTQRAQELAKELKVEQGHTIPNPMKAR